MDTLTHALAGAAVSDGWFRNRLGPLATPAALVLAALPDLDIPVSWLWSPDNPWLVHRGYSHGFLPTLLAAPLVGLALARLTGRPASFQSWTLLAWSCFYSHIVLDIVTSWGTMALLPFSRSRLTLDAAPMLDIFVFSLSLASFIGNRWLRRERVETFMNPLAKPMVRRHPRRVRWAGRLARPAAILILCYLLVGWLQSRQAAEIARKELAAAGIEVVETRALPLLFTQLAWEIAARDRQGNIYNAVYSSFARKRMRFIRRRMGSGPAVAAALASREGERFAWFTQGMFTAESEAASDGERVSLRDWRFFSLIPPRDPRFVLEIDFDSGLNFRASRESRTALGGLGEELNLLWRLTFFGESGEERETPEGL
ncbi:MAG: metal-dependent hydrolase [Planctomycetota bacterium]|jgi:membrane-bound metal-dependent hydrolase YbcI (DUF457 family)|nr:metal-dependent hydrolase [Planctomycetota bacterium]